MKVFFGTLLGAVLGAGLMWAACAWYINQTERERDYWKTTVATWEVVSATCQTGIAVCELSCQTRMFQGGVASK